MSWYRTGTASFTNGSAAVTGSGTTWNSNIAGGEAVLGPDGRIYEILSIGSDTALTLGSPYLGSNVGGASYVVAPTQSYLRDLAAQAAALIGSYSSIAGGVFTAVKAGDGSAATPGLTFNLDQDTGFYRPGSNVVGMGTAGVERIRVDSTGLVVTTPSPMVNIAASSGANSTLRLGQSGVVNWEIQNKATTGELSFNVGGSSHVSVLTDGSVGIGTTPAAAFHLSRSGTVELRIATRTTGDPSIQFLAEGVNSARVNYSRSDQALQFLCGGVERMRIDVNGKLLVGKASPSGGVAGTEIAMSGEVLISRAGRPLWLNRLSSDGAIVDFTRDAAGVGSISVTTTATAYNTSSDYRLKENPQPLTGSGAFIDALQPKTWGWVIDGTPGVGFIAHEAAVVSPSSVVGEMDAVDAGGDPVYQAMEYGSAEFIANIVAELQSLRLRVAALEVA